MSFGPYHPGEERLLPRAVVRALSAMRAAPERPFTLADLARIAGVSTRTLQRQFRVFLRQTPLATLRDVRLECARRDLLRGSRRATVAEIAVRYGFSHLGRFSAEYRRRYGEKPSQTLQRATSFPGLQANRLHLISLAHDRPLIAVTPMEVSDNDGGVAQGVAAEIRTALICAGMAVTERMEHAAYRLHGIYRRSGQHVHLTFRLIEAVTGRLIWAHQHDGTAEDAFYFEERLAAKVSAAMQPVLRTAESARASRKPETDLTATDLAMMALPHVLMLNPEGHKRALDLLDRATSRDPRHSLSIALAAWCYAQRVVYQFTNTPAEDRARALEFASRAIAIGGDAMTFAILGHALALAHDLDMASKVTSQALLLDGASAWAWMRSGWLDMYSGRAESAIERFSLSLELSPNDPLAFNNFVGMASAHFHARRYTETTRWDERALAAHPSAVWIHRRLCPAYVLCGGKDEATRSLAVFRRTYPEATALQCATAAPSPAEDQHLMAEVLEGMGLPP